MSTQNLERQTAAVSVAPRLTPARSTSAPEPPKASKLLISTMGLARFGVSLAVTAPINFTLTLKVQDLVGPAGAVAALGAVTAAGAAAAFVANPIFGRLSDRTTGRFGRRRPWLVLGSGGLLLALLALALAPTVLLASLAWLAGQVFANAVYAAHTATLPDQIPASQRGAVSGMLGLSQNVAVLAAVYLMKYLGDGLVTLFLVPGAIGVALVLLFALVLPDRPLDQKPPTDGGLRALLKTFWVSPRRHPDFALAWLSRFLIVLANFMFTTFRVLFLQHTLGLDKAGTAGVLANGVLVFTVVLAVTGQFAGWLSDKWQRRKIFVASAAVLFGIGVLMLVTAHSPGHFYLAEAVLGLGYGIYIGVDLALVVDVLPDKENAAKDLGVFNIALAFPQAIAPVLGAILITLGGGNYDLMFAIAGVLAFAGALAIVPIRSVR